MIVKLVHESEIHLYRGELTLQCLKQYSSKVFKDLEKCMDKIQFFYTDDDGDRISVCCQIDMENFKTDRKQSKISKLCIQVKNDEILDPEKDIDINSVASQSNVSHQLSQLMESMMLKPSSKAITQKISRFKKEAILEEQITKFYDQICQKIGNSASNQNRKLLKEEVSSFVDTISKQSMRIFFNSAQQCNNKIYQQIGVQTDDLLSQQFLKHQFVHKLADEKVKEMIPTIMNKLMKSVETKLKVEGNTHNKNNKNLRRRSF